MKKLGSHTSWLKVLTQPSFPDAIRGIVRRVAKLETSYLKRSKLSRKLRNMQARGIVLWHLPWRFLRMQISMVTSRKRRLNLVSLSLEPHVWRIFCSTMWRDVWMTLREQRFSAGCLQVTRDPQQRWLVSSVECFLPSRTRFLRLLWTIERKNRFTWLRLTTTENWAAK